MVERLLRQGGV